MDLFVLLSAMLAQFTTPPTDPSVVTNFFGTTASAAGTFVGTFLVGALLLVLAPNWTQKIIDTIEDDPLPSFLWGVGIFIALILVTIALVITIIGIALAIPLIFVMIFVSLIGGAIVFIVVGERVLDAVDMESSRWGHLAVGALLAAILAAIPVVGGVTNFIVNSVGVGAIAYRWRQG